MKRYRADIIEIRNNLKVVEIDAPTLEDAEKEILHYGMMYSQDGDIKVVRKYKIGKTMKGCK